MSGASDRSQDAEGGVGQAAAGGMAWASLGVGGRAFLRIAVLAVLARLISPTEFGVITAALVVVGLFSTFAEVSLGPALVQRDRLDTAHVRVAWTILVVLGSVLWVVVYVAAPWISGLFAIDGLTPVLRVMAAVFVVNNLTVSDFLLAREMRFATLAKIGMSAYLIGYGVVTVTLALLGYGVWSIVAGAITETAVRVAASYRMRPHPLTPLFSRGPARDLLGFGGGSTLAGTGQLIAHQADNVVVGRFLGPAALGLYGRAYQLMAMPAQLFLTAMTRVLFPAMSSMQRHPRRLRRAYLTALGGMALVVLPVSVAAALLSGELILLVLGPDWVELQTAFSIIVLGMFFRAVPGVADCVSMATGAVYRQALRKWIYAAMIIGFALIGQRGGVSGVAAAVLLAMACNTAMQTQLGLTLVGGRWGEVARAIRPGLAVTAVAAAVTHGVASIARASGAGSTVVLLTAASATALACLLTGRLAPRIDGLGELASLLRTIRSTAGSTRVGDLIGRVLGPAYPAAFSVAAREVTT